MSKAKSINQVAVEDAAAKAQEAIEAMTAADEKASDSVSLQKPEEAKGEATETQTELDLEPVGDDVRMITLEDIANEFDTTPDELDIIVNSLDAEKAAGKKVPGGLLKFLNKVVKHLNEIAEENGTIEGDEVEDGTAKGSGKSKIPDRFVITPPKEYPVKGEELFPRYQEGVYIPYDSETVINRRDYKRIMVPIADSVYRKCGFDKYPEMGRLLLRVIYDNLQKPTAIKQYRCDGKDYVSQKDPMLNCGLFGFTNIEDARYVGIAEDCDYYIILNVPKAKYSEYVLSDAIDVLIPYPGFNGVLDGTDEYLDVGEVGVLDNSNTIEAIILPYENIVKMILDLNVIVESELNIYNRTLSSNIAPLARMSNGNVIVANRQHCAEVPEAV